MFDYRNGLPIRCVISPDVPTFPDFRRSSLRFQEPLEITATTAGTAEVTEAQDRSMLKPDPSRATVEICEPLWNHMEPQKLQFSCRFFQTQFTCQIL